jgi:hypothetical protein
MTRHLLAAALILIAGTSLQAQEAPSARSTSATMNVSARVLARTVVSIEDEPRQVVVTEDDVRRGYVTLPSSLRFSVRSNSRDGYLLEFSQLDPAFRTMSVRWDSTEIRLGSDGAVISQPFAPGLVQRVADVQLTLAEGTQPGTYGWGVRVNGGSLN